MATSTLAPFYLDGTPSIEALGDLFAVEFDGLSLRLTPHALLALVEIGRRRHAAWDYASRFRDERKVIHHPAQLGRKAVQS